MKQEQERKIIDKKEHEIRIRAFKYHIKDPEIVPREQLNKSRSTHTVLRDFATRTAICLLNYTLCDVHFSSQVQRVGHGILTTEIKEKLSLMYHMMVSPKDALDWGTRRDSPDTISELSTITNEAVVSALEELSSGDKKRWINLLGSEKQQGNVIDLSKEEGPLLVVATRRMYLLSRRGGKSEGDGDWYRVFKGGAQPLDAETLSTHNLRLLLKFTQ